MHAWSHARLEDLAAMGLSGYILKRSSPSCGMERVPVKDAKGMPQTEADLASHSLISYVEDLVAAQSLNYGPEFFGSAKPNFSVSSALGQLEAVRSGAGIGILHRFIARPHPELIQVLPQISLSRAYFIVYHESMRTLRRINAVTQFIAGIVERERNIFN